MEWILILTFVYSSTAMSSITVSDIKTQNDCVRLAENQIKAVSARSKNGYTGIETYYSCTQVTK